MRALARKPSDFNLFRVRQRKRAKGYEDARAKAAKQGNDLPPEQQYRRRRADPVLNLYSRNHLTDRQYRAAIDIRMVCEGMTAAALKSSFDPDKFFLAGIHSSTQPGGPAGDTVVGFLQQYKRWERKVKQRKVQGGRVSWYRVARAVVVMHRTPSDLDKVYRWRKGTAIGILRKALDVF